jgi:1-acyl-sn-glycerol-3-phosphate acyltransferase
VCNHQSYLDPLIIGLPLKKYPFYIARKTLLSHFLLRKVLLLFRKNIVFIEREEFSLRSFKELVAKLWSVRAPIVIFPEGTRSYDGRIQPLKRGFAILSKVLRRNVELFYIEGSGKVLGRNQLFVRLFIPISLYYIKKIIYNHNSAKLIKEVEEHYRRIQTNGSRKRSQG